LLFLGVRRSDVVLLGPSQVRDEVISFVPRKTSYKRKTPSHKPILPILRRIIDASPTGDKTFLVTSYGQPFTAAGFGMRMRQWCDDAGLQQCSAHGLRKAGATMAAENGATTHQLMAIYDWATPAQAEVYTRTADRKRLAQSAMHLLENRSGTALPERN
jgi:integrase